MVTSLFLLSSLLVAQAQAAAAGPVPADLPRGEEVKVDTREGEIRFAAEVKHPVGKPCIDDFGQRIQAFVGSAKAGGKPSEFADHFVFLAPADTESVYRGLAEVGANTEKHMSRAEGKASAGKGHLDGTPVELFVGWTDKAGRWVEKRYEDLVQEKIVVNGKEQVAPWKPKFVFHGSGVIHKEGTGCIACPCDCPGGLIADVRFPIYEPKPTVKFDWSQAPPEGSQVVVRIRLARPEAKR